MRMRQHEEPTRLHVHGGYEIPLTRRQLQIADATPVFDRLLSRLSVTGLESNEESTF